MQSRPPSRTKGSIRIKPQALTPAQLAMASEPDTTREECMLTRRDLGAAALASAALGGRSPFAFAQGAKHSLKVGGQFQASHPASVAMDEACAEIRKESNGEIDIQFFPNAQLGSDAA